MSYIEIETVQGPILLDPDRISGVGQAIGGTAEGKPELYVLVLFVGGVNIDLHVTKDLADRVIEEVKNIIKKRKIRQPSTPIILK